MSLSLGGNQAIAEKIVCDSLVSDNITCSTLTANDIECNTINNLGIPYSVVFQQNYNSITTNIIEDVFTTAYNNYEITIGCKFGNSMSVGIGNGGVTTLSVWSYVTSNIHSASVDTTNDSAETYIPIMFNNQNITFRLYNVVNNGLPIQSGIRLVCEPNADLNVPPNQYLISGTAAIVSGLQTDLTLTSTGGGANTSVTIRGFN